jgi:hypothetical protein
MYLINPQNEYPLFIGDLQLEHEDWQEGDVLPEGWFEVEQIERPTFDETTETVYEINPVKKNGKFIQVWEKRLMTEEELFFRSRQIIRNKVMFGEPLTAEEADTLVI